jgi:hypothetical protein
MTMHSVFYEFPVNKQNIEFLVEDLGITQRLAPDFPEIANNLLDLVNDSESTYAQVEICGKPGLMLRFSRNLRAERLSHPIEGAHAFIHASSEGHLELEDFKRYFEASLQLHKIEYNKY